LKAAAAAASESGPDVGKRIHQRHFERAMEDVVGNRSVMRQSVLDDALQRTDPAVQAVQAMEERWRMTALVAAGLAVVALLVAVGALGIVLGR
jgi:ABC-type ATPase with predicted acetyltransferase domain